jgi:hypothetical protein
MKVSARQRRLVAQKEFEKPLEKFQQINLSECVKIPTGMTRAFKNTRYIVMVFDHHLTTTGTAVVAMVQKLDNTPILGHWKEMQKIKNELFGEETVAVEYYPPQSQLVDTANIYWLCMYPSIPLLVNT